VGDYPPRAATTVRGIDDARVRSTDTGTLTVAVPMDTPPG
jgi:hypothetical protein